MNSKRKRLQRLHDEKSFNLDDEEVLLDSSLRKGGTSKGRKITANEDNARLGRVTSTNPQNSSRKAFNHPLDMESFPDKSGNIFSIEIPSPSSSDHSKKPTMREAIPGKANRKRYRANSYFSDGTRRVDFVLAYDLAEDSTRNNSVDEDEEPSSGASKSSPERHSDKRRIFETNLQLLGLEVEYASGLHTNTHFVLIHAPFQVLLKQAEVMNIKMPVHQNDIRKHTNLMDGAVNMFLRRFKFLDFDEKVKKRIDPPDYFTQPFVEQHLNCFINYEDEKSFFSYCDRSRMVYDLLIRTRYDRGEKNKFRFGIERLIQGGSYSAAYPLHDEIKYHDRDVNYDTCSDRQLLWETWVKQENVCKYQPLNLIKNYFGTKIGFYFAWLGYYTRFLYVISILGVFCVFYGVLSMSEDVPSNDICGEDGIGAKILICPVCEKYCDFTPLSSSCIYAKLTYVFDNGATIFFAAVMSIWATLFLECWKRYHAELAYKWNVLDYEREQEVMRPEFQYRQGKFKTNPVTQQKEPYVPTIEKILRIMGSGVAVLFFLCLVVALVLGIIAYRAIVMHVFFTVEDNEFLQSKAVLVTSVTAAIINLVFILIMNYFYNILALKLTNLECPRTQTDFDNSYALKVFLFQFINFYSSLFYIAFIKGRFSGIPEYDNDRFKSEVSGIRIFGQRLEECDPSGCMVELVIQLFIIMCGKQIFNGFMELAYPIITNWFRKWRLRLPETKKQRTIRLRQESQRDIIDGKASHMPLFERDYFLNPVWEQFLFDEYLEMVIQFGFVTLFVAAFPLAPLFALLNNILEIRLDAYKFIVTTRRPTPQIARNIGIWMTILDLLSNVAVLCNAFVIAFTSDFIPKLYYYLVKHTMYGYIDDSLSYFDSSDIDVRNSNFHNVSVCRYRDLRLPPCHLGLEGQCADDYSLQNKWWSILAFRLIFVLVFEIVVLSIKAIFAYIIPDMPTKVVVQLQRERYLARQAILQRTDTVSSRFSPDSNKIVNGRETSLCRSNDVEAVAYQPGQETKEETNRNPSPTEQRGLDNFRRLYSNRRQPSLSPRASRTNLSRMGDDARKNQSGNVSSSSSSLSPYHFTVDYPQHMQQPTSITIQTVEPIEMDAVPLDPVTRSGIKSSKSKSDSPTDSYYSAKGTPK
ncbi:calcium-activated chloride channel domain-containing protein [Ditylenchus destructor]|nr:calcium-activated chloride channel domain-containing protein [Ditylenchus destructor]